MASGKDGNFLKMKRKNADVKQNPHFEEKKKYKGSPSLGDPKLIPRIRQVNKRNTVIFLYYRPRPWYNCLSPIHFRQVRKMGCLFTALFSQVRLQVSG
jgi:hypothetical protein